MSDVDDREIERALVEILDLAGPSDDPATLDRAIDLCLARFGDDHAARLLAIRRLTTALIQRDRSAAEDSTQASAAARRR